MADKLFASKDNIRPCGNPMRYIFPCILLALTTCLNADEPKSKAIRKYENEVEVLRKQGQAAIKRLEGVFEKEVEKLRGKTLTALQKELDAALESKDLDKAVALREAIKAFEGAEASGLAAKAEVASKKKIKKRIPRDALRFRGHHYQLVLQGVSWHMARKIATESGGHLLLINSLEEHAFIATALNLRNLRNIDFWIDGTCEEDLSTFLSFSGNQLNLQNCRLGGLDKADGENYLRLDGTDKRWTVNDTHPHYENNFIIEWDN